MRSMTLSESQSAEQKKKSDNRILKRRDSEIIKVLNYVFVLIGLPEESMPNLINQEILATFIKTAYPNQSIDDVKDAFHGAIANKFLIDPKKSVNDLGLYGEIISSKYFGKVINAYMNYKASLPEPTMPASKQLAEENPDNRTQEQKDVASLEVHIKMTKELGKVPDMIFVNECFRALQKQNKLNLTEENINHIRSIVKSELISESQGATIILERMGNTLQTITDTNPQEGIFSNDFKELEKRRKAKGDINNDKEIRYRMKKKYVEEYLKQFIA